MYSFKLSQHDLRRVIDLFVAFHKRFSHFFRTKTRSVARQAQAYSAGQIQSDTRRNLVKFTHCVPEVNEQAMQHFISNSSWKDAPLIAQLQQDVDRLIGDPNEGALILDESGFPKQGKHSVGVKRQYCGALGKVDNCQVGVFLAYAKDSNTTLIDRRLYLPKDWANDKERHQKAGVPEDVTFKTKAQLGLEMILDAHSRELRFGWVGMDAHYGEQPWLRNQLDDEDIIYMADIPVTHRIFLEKPNLLIPKRKGNRGRKPTKLKPDTVPLNVKAFLEVQPAECWHRLKIRDTERGELEADFAAFRIFSVNGQGLPDREVWLVVRREIDDPKEMKFAFSNAPEETSIERLASMLCSRYWVERALQNAKGEAGLDEYEVRSWQAWHHHMSMTMLSMLFLLQVQLMFKEKASMLTIQDARWILKKLLPRREITPEEILKLIQKRHKARFSARKSRMKHK